MLWCLCNGELVSNNHYAVITLVDRLNYSYKHTVRCEKLCVIIILYLKPQCFSGGVTLIILFPYFSYGIDIGTWVNF